ncbi:MAG: prepilin-type N-terminal cleavage/methylation domain-containing protein [Verrucomicrobiota bacterium]
MNPAIPEKGANRHRRGFTLLEVLVAALFMIVVIPVALSGMRISTMAGESGQRKLVATRIATKVINELRAENLLLNGAQRGVVQENGVTYSWSEKTEFWNADPLSQMYTATITVDYFVAGHPCSVQLSTLVPPAI